MAIPISIRAYARHRGCSQGGPQCDQSRADYEGFEWQHRSGQADAEWAANTRGHARKRARKKQDPNDEELLPVANEAIDHVRDLLGKNSDSVTLLEARVAKTIADAHQSRLKALRMEGLLIDREAAERFVFACIDSCATPSSPGQLGPRRSWPTRWVWTRPNCTRHWSDMSTICAPNSPRSSPMTSGEGLQDFPVWCGLGARRLRPSRAHGIGVGGCVSHPSVDVGGAGSLAHGSRALHERDHGCALQPSPC